jgi:hypothetical protein
MLGESRPKAVKLGLINSGHSYPPLSLSVRVSPEHNVLAPHIAIMYFPRKVTKASSIVLLTSLGLG